MLHFVGKGVLLRRTLDSRGGKAKAQEPLNDARYRGKSVESRFPLLHSCSACFFNFPSPTRAITVEHVCTRGHYQVAEV